MATQRTHCAAWTLTAAIVTIALIPGPVLAEAPAPFPTLPGLGASSPATNQTSTAPVPDDLTELAETVGRPSMEGTTDKNSPAKMPILPGVMDSGAIPVAGVDNLPPPAAVSSDNSLATHSEGTSEDTSVASDNASSAEASMASETKATSESDASSDGQPAFAAIEESVPSGQNGEDSQDSQEGVNAPPKPLTVEESVNFEEKEAVVTPVAAPTSFEGTEDPIFFEALPSMATPRGGDAWIALGHDTGPGVGYEQSFTQFQGYFPLLFERDRWIWFADADLLLSNTSNLGTNLGTGYRFYSPGMNRIFGGYGYFDNRDTGMATFSQLSVGLESLGELYDFRSNVYVPVGSTTKAITPFDNPTFSGNQIILERTTLNAMTGIDMEAGRLFFARNNIELRGFGGWYHFQAENTPQAWGAMGRVGLRFTDNLMCDLTLRNDTVFNTTLVFGVQWRIRGIREFGRKPLDHSVVARLNDPTKRNKNIAVAKGTEYAAAINSATGSAFTVVHVNNLSANGSGTFESPYSSIEEAEKNSHPNDIIYVYAGDGSVQQLSSSLVLQDGQRLLGEGTTHAIEATQGVYLLPGYNLVDAPKISATGDAIIMGNDTQVAGVELTNVGGRGIVATGVNNPVVYKTTLTNVVGDAIAFKNVTGNATVLQTNINNEGVTSGSGAGIRIETNSDLTVKLGTNSILNTRGSGVVMKFGGSGAVDAEISNSTINYNGKGTGAAAIDVSATGSGEVVLYTANNDVVENAGDGMRFSVSGDRVLKADTISNWIEGNGGTGITLAGTGNAEIYEYMAGNLLLKQTGVGINVDITGSSTLDLSLEKNNVDQNVADGMVFNVGGSAELTGYMTDSRVGSGEAGGLVISADGSSSVTFTLTSSEYVDNATNGIHAISNNSSNVTLFVAGVYAQENQQEGILFESFGNSRLGGGIAQNTFSDNVQSSGSADFLALARDHSTIELSLRNNEAVAGYSVMTLDAGATVSVEDTLSSNVGTFSQAGNVNTVAAESLFPLDDESE